MKAGCNTTAEVISAVFIIMSSIFGLFILTIFAIGRNQRNHIKLSNIFKCLKKTDDNDEQEQVSQEPQQSNREDGELEVKQEVQEIEDNQEEKLSRSEQLKFALMKQVSKFRDRAYEKEKRIAEDTDKEINEDIDIQKDDSELKESQLEKDLHDPTRIPDRLKLVNGIKNKITQQVTKLTTKTSSKDETEVLKSSEISSTVVKEETNEQKEPESQDN